MAIADFLADTSAVTRIPHSEAVEERLTNLMGRGLVATCAILDLEALWSARSPADYESIWTQRGAVMEYVETRDEDWQRALEVQRDLARSSQHRGVPIPDLIIAAVAEREGLTILHYDQDFDTIAEVTGQPVEWVVPQGTVDA